MSSSLSSSAVAGKGDSGKRDEKKANTKIDISSESSKHIPVMGAALGKVDRKLDVCNDLLFCEKIAEFRALATAQVEEKIAKKGKDMVKLCLDYLASPHTIVAGLLCCYGVDPKLPIEKVAEVLEQKITSFKFGSAPSHHQIDQKTAEPRINIVLASWKAYKANIIKCTTADIRFGFTSLPGGSDDAWYKTVTWESLWTNQRFLVLKESDKYHHLSDLVVLGALRGAHWNQWKLFTPSVSNTKTSAVAVVSDTKLVLVKARHEMYTLVDYCVFYAIWFANAVRRMCFGDSLDSLNARREYISRIDHLLDTSNYLLRVFALRPFLRGREELEALEEAFMNDESAKDSLDRANRTVENKESPPRRSHGLGKVMSRLALSHAGRYIPPRFSSSAVDGDEKAHRAQFEYFWGKLRDDIKATHNKVEIEDGVDAIECKWIHAQWVIHLQSHPQSMKWIKWINDASRVYDNDEKKASYLEIVASIVASDTDNVDLPTPIVEFFKAMYSQRTASFAAEFDSCVRRFVRYVARPEVVTDWKEVLAQSLSRANEAVTYLAGLDLGLGYIGSDPGPGVKDADTVPDEFSLYFNERQPLNITPVGDGDGKISLGDAIEKLRAHFVRISKESKQASPIRLRSRLVRNLIDIIFRR
jgi:hypothetical protein